MHHGFAQIRLAEVGIDELCPREIRVVQARAYKSRAVKGSKRDIA